MIDIYNHNGESVSPVTRHVLAQYLCPSCDELRDRNDATEAPCRRCGVCAVCAPDPGGCGASDLCGSCRVESRPEPVKRLAYRYRVCGPCGGFTGIYCSDCIEAGSPICWDADHTKERAKPAMQLLHPGTRCDWCDAPVRPFERGERT